MHGEIVASEKPRERCPASINKQMKLLSAVAAIAVCVGHITPLRFAGPFALFPPYSFQVAAFVFISGYFYREKRAEEHPLRYIGHNFKKLIIPLLAINSAYSLICFALQSAFGFNFNVALDPASLAVDPFFFGNAAPVAAPMWFISPLFFALLANAAIRIPLRRMTSRACVEVGLFIVYNALGFIAMLVGGKRGLPMGPELAICRVFIFLSWFSLGRMYKVLLEPLDRIPNTLYFVAVILIQLLLTYIAGEPIVYNSSWCKFYQGPILSFCSTLCSLAFWLRACRIAEPLIDRFSLLRTIGDSTFSIMSHHMFGYLLVTLCFCLCHSIFHFPNAFDIAQAKTDPVGFFFYPGGLTQFAAIYVLFALTFSLAVHKLWTSIKTAVKPLFNKPRES